jgi:hypothetical protein
MGCHDHLANNEAQLQFLWDWLSATNSFSRLTASWPSRPAFIKPGYSAARLTGALTNQPKLFMFLLYVLSHTLPFLEASTCSYVLHASSLELLAFDIGGDTVSTGTMKFKLHVERPVGSQILMGLNIIADDYAYAVAA